jgi:ATP/maltotriose-dependent transcriptional regulator MalT
MAAVITETLARVRLDGGDPDAAAEQLGPAVAYYRRTGMRPYLARALELAARVHEAAGRAEAAAEARAEAATVRAAMAVPTPDPPPVPAS